MNLENIYVSLSGEDGFTFVSPYGGYEEKCFTHGIRGYDSCEGIIYPALPIIKVLAKDNEKLLIAVCRSNYTGYEKPIITIASSNILKNLIPLSKGLEQAKPIFKKYFDYNIWGENNKIDKNLLYGNRIVKDSLVGTEDVDYTPVNVYYESPFLAVCEKSIQLDNCFTNEVYFVQNVNGDRRQNYKDLENKNLDLITEKSSINEILYKMESLKLINNERYCKDLINNTIENLKQDIKRLSHTIKNYNKIMFIHGVTQKPPAKEQYKHLYTAYKNKLRDLKIFNIKILDSKIEKSKTNHIKEKNEEFTM